MSDATAPFVRLFGPEDLPVRIPDWPEEVGVAVCRVAGKTVAMLPYHEGEAGSALRRRLIDEVGQQMGGLSVYPALHGVPEAKIPFAEDQRITTELGGALRSMPRLIEAVQDFAINFEFATEEGLGLDGLSDSARRQAASGPTDQLPVGYRLFEKADSSCEVIAGAVLRPLGAAGVDLVLVPNNGMPSREMPPEVQVLVRDDSTRVAVPLANALVKGRLPPVMRLPAGALMLGQSGGKPVPALVMRRGNFLFVAPEYGAIAAPAATVASAEKARGSFPWLWVLAGLLALVVIAGAAVGTVYILQQDRAAPVSQAPVDNLRSNMFAP